ncbi:MAG: hybrid sensor histidine kinase/response regulator, partial [Ktedonobacterales bacterium]
MSMSEQVNILMVDDQPAKLLSYETILADLDVQLIKATSGREALEHLLKTEIAIVLMDVSMPEIDGFELAAMIRQHPRYQKVAILFISAVRLTELDRLKGYEVGAVDYIPVPVIPEILRAKVSVFADLFRKTHQLETLNYELERRVEERTAALEAATAREREARLAAEAALRVRDEFLSVAAHELKTPVTGLRATAQILARKLQKGALDVPDWLSNGLRTIEQQSDRLTRLIGQLLDVSRLDQEQQSAQRAPTNLTELAERLVAAFTARTSKHRLVLHAEPRVIAEVDAV